MLSITLMMLLVAAVLFVASFPLDSLSENAIALPILLMAQIVLGTQVLSLTHHLGITGYWVMHILMLSTSIALWIWRGRPAVVAPWRSLPHATRWFFETHNRLFMLTCLMLLFVAYRALDGALRESYFLDAFVYHIPRALFWLQTALLNIFSHRIFVWLNFHQMRLISIHGCWHFLATLSA